MDNHAAAFNEEEAFLQSLLPHEVLAATFQQRTREKWNRQQQDWERTKLQLAQRTGTQPKDLAISHAEGWRKVVEVSATL